MLIPSIEELASRARDVAKYQGIRVLDAIRSVAKEYGVESSPIARELARRSVAMKNQKRLAKENATELEHTEELARMYREKHLHDARAHEMDMKRGFITARHLNDY